MGGMCEIRSIIGLVGMCIKSVLVASQFVYVYYVLFGHRREGA